MGNTIHSLHGRFKTSPASISQDIHKIPMLISCSCRHTVVHTIHNPKYVNETLNSQSKIYIHTITRRLTVIFAKVEVIRSIFR